jgi:hypothetical protein
VPEEPVSNGGVQQKATGSRTSFPWSTATETAAIAALLLPVTGALVRWIAFRFDERIPTNMAVAASVPDLALLGALAAVPGLLYTAALVAAYYLWERSSVRARAIHRRFDELDDRAVSIRQRNAELKQRLTALKVEIGKVDHASEHDPVPEDIAGTMRSIDRDADELNAQLSILEAEMAKAHAEAAQLVGSRFSQALVRIPRVVLVAFTVFSVVFTVFIAVAAVPMTVSVPMSFVALIATAMLVRPIPRGSSQPSLVRAAAAAAVLTIGTATVFAISGNLGLRAVYFDASSTSSAAIAPGWYGIVGESDPFLYLLPCAPGQPVSAVLTDSIQGFEYAPRRAAVDLNPSALDMVIRGRVPRLGADLGCSALTGDPTP